MVGSLTVNAARDKARRWLDLISKGIDPKIEEKRLRAEAKRHQDATFGRVANDFLDGRAIRSAKAKEVWSIIETLNRAG
jgi:Arm DNA-binding domain